VCPNIWTLSNPVRHILTIIDIKKINLGFLIFMPTDHCRATDRMILDARCWIKRDNYQPPKHYLEHYSYLFGVENPVSKPKYSRSWSDF